MTELSRPRCIACARYAVWRWACPCGSPAFLCDDHAADKDLSDLTDLIDPAEVHAV